MRTEDIKKMMEAYLEVVSEKSCGSDRKKMEEKEVECPKCKGEGCDHCDNTGKHKVDEKKLDPVNDKENDKEFKDRKDKDIDNDGDVDSSDEYLHKKRAATDDAIDGGKKPAENGGKDDKKKKPAANSGEKTAEISKIGEKATTKEDVDALIDALTEAANPKKGATPPEGLTDKESPKSKEFAKAHDKSEKKYEDDEEDGHDKTFAAGKATKEAPKRPGDNKSGDKNVVNPVKEDTRTYQQKIMDVLSGKTWGEIANEVNELKGENE